ncbi:hypothetical protein [Desulfuromonas sp. CSMB_57]|jgi:hypothetical protein|uniref:hypothetical protein n=1 Tax=Desulfuromonas sp. CSMB_57 TaxID=2807629 RepID=UPI001CD4F53F|nr:hypothetical protein [Desulfuromonas sp. CSMB_57]
MAMSDDRLQALEKVAETARNLERLLSGTVHPGIESEKLLLLDELKKAVHRLDDIEGKREPVGKLEKWQG